MHGAMSGATLLCRPRMHPDRRNPVRSEVPPGPSWLVLCEKFYRSFDDPFHCPTRAKFSLRSAVSVGRSGHGEAARGMRMPPATEAAMEVRTRSTTWAGHSRRAALSSTAPPVSIGGYAKMSRGGRLPRGDKPGPGAPNYLLSWWQRQSKRTCHVVWRSDTRLGVEFRAA